MKGNWERLERMINELNKQIMNDIISSKKLDTVKETLGVKDLRKREQL